MFTTYSPFFSYPLLEIIETTTDGLTYHHKFTDQGWKSSPSTLAPRDRHFSTLVDAKADLLSESNQQILNASAHIANLQQQLDDHLLTYQRLTADLQLNHPEVLI
jgi:hypothetical protein